ncbi:hypothetical protein L6452_34357 [Arctium lappa]|uniref:Uncharacterized protein n=1 Tax=Arctium lappa TaxID=4217 RepID=A0ACB8YI82_ARCLA|nr:hypothetical protein L6452_34357 [Arctium lappa]
MALTTDFFSSFLGTYHSSPPVHCSSLRLFATTFLSQPPPLLPPSSALTISWEVAEGIGDPMKRVQMSRENGSKTLLFLPVKKDKIREGGGLVVVS